MNDRLHHITYCLGIILILIQAEIGNIRSSAQPIQRPPSSICDTKQLLNGNLYVNCAAKNLELFPDFSEQKQIQILNISMNPLLYVVRYLLANFTELEELIMHHVNLDLIEEDFLLPLTNLQILDISSSFSGISLSNIDLPSTIRQLRVDSFSSGNGESEAEFTNLGNLSELSARSNALKRFPKLNDTCPIISIDLSDNPLSKFKYQDLAPFCTLETLFLNETKVQSSESCCGLKLWMSTFGVLCDDGYLDDDAKEMYRECEVRIGANQTSTPTFLLEFFFVLALIGATLFLVYKYYNSRAVVIEKQEEIEEEESDE